MVIFTVFVAVIVIFGLAFYAGSLLSKLKIQNQNRQKITQTRIVNIIESIQTIAKGVEQKQCNLSEGCIRLFHLLEALPIRDKPNYSQQYDGLYTLYESVKDFPTHQLRMEQSKLETRKQDIKRAKLEADLETKILVEVSKLAKFTVEDY